MVQEKCNSKRQVWSTRVALDLQQELVVSAGSVSLPSLSSTEMFGRVPESCQGQWENREGGGVGGGEQGSELSGHFTLTTNHPI